MSHTFTFQMSSSPTIRVKSLESHFIEINSDNDSYVCWYSGGGTLGAVYFFGDWLRARSSSWLGCQSGSIRLCQSLFIRFCQSLSCVPGQCRIKSIFYKGFYNRIVNIVVIQNCNDFGDTLYIKRQKIDHAKISKTNELIFFPYQTTRKSARENCCPILKYQFPTALVYGE